ncbi:hypothetical protein QQ045_019004 [Rhodiola kirilowii]
MFNSAVLMKQLWRMIKNPDLLTSTIFRTRYFSDGCLPAAGTGYRPSHAWRSLMKVKNLFLEGLELGVCNSNSRWLPSESWDFSCKMAYNMIYAHEVRLMNPYGEGSSSNPVQVF